MTDLHFLTIAQASALIRARKLSPVELTRVFLERVRLLDANLNSHLLLLEEQATEDAKAAETEIAAGRWKGPLHGIPIGLKDIYNTAGIRTTGHSALFRDHVPTEDAFTVGLLKQAGAVITSKLATWEFAIGGTSFDLPWPPARNPWDTALDPSGSSSGSAVAVAAGLCMGAMGSDTGGSIRGPAAYRRAQADLWTAQPAWHSSTVVLAGSRRPDVLDQRGLRADAAGAGAPRSSGCHQRICCSGGLHHRSGADVERAADRGRAALF
jgi:Asp-tRNA(Asn)/Glu-tRNA(Gln) amidotransferase A subunit family amidase